MKEKSVSQGELAVKCGVTQGTVSRWIKGVIPALETLKTIEEHLGVPWQWLLVDVNGAKRIIEWGRSAASSLLSPSPPAKPRAPKRRGAERLAG